MMCLIVKESMNHLVVAQSTFFNYTVLILNSLNQFFNQYHLYFIEEKIGIG